MNVLLFIIAYVLFLPLTFINYVVVEITGKGKGYFRSSAVNLDKFANREFRTLWNITLRKSYGYEFGNVNETISSALGKNKIGKSLTTTGKILVAILDTIDKNHCVKSIKYFE